MVYSTGMQPLPPTVLAPVPVSDASVGKCSSVANIFKTLQHTLTHTHTQTHTHTLTTTTEMSSLCFNEMCVACVRSRNARRRRRRAAEKSVCRGKGAVRQRCCCHLKNCAQKYATVCRAFNINTIYVALTSFYFFFGIYLFASSFLS